MDHVYHPIGDTVASQAGWRFILEACDGDQSLCCQVKWLKRRSYLGDSISIRLLFQAHLHPTQSIQFFSFKFTVMNSGRILWDRDLQNFGPKAKNSLTVSFGACVHACVCQAVTTQGLQLLDCRPCYLHIFAAVATRIFETRCDGSSQVWSPLMVHEQLLEPLVRQSTSHGHLWHSCDHFLEAAWSRPAYPQWTWYFFVGHPWHAFWEFISEDYHLDHPLCCQAKWRKPRLYLRDLVSIRFLFQVHLHPIHSLNFESTPKSQEYVTVSFGACVHACVCQAVTTQGLQLLDCRPCYLHIFAAVATRIFETRCDGSSQVWSPLMVHEQLLEPLVRQSTCHGLLWHSCDYSLEGAAWSRPAYPQWTWYFFVGHPWHVFWGFISEDCDLDHPLRCQVKWLERRLNAWLCLLAPLSVCQAVTTQVLQLLHCRPCYLHIFAAVATRIFETRCDGSSQVWSPLMVHEQLLEPLVRQSTCHRLLWHICRRHSLEGAASSRPAYPQWTWYFFVKHPWCLALGSHLWSLRFGSVFVLQS